MEQAVAKSNVEKNKKLTNHSGRKTAITRLLDEGVPITSVQQHTCHKSVQSLNNYAKNSLKPPKKCRPSWVEIYHLLQPMKVLCQF